ncbi:hypothetical protein [Pseudomonas hormoni]|uniref:hypothetical protein n=1 Tax=Pseudomonas hormoni TaxID=3093767 RepID=UPI00202906EC|nr:hypothetical protein [Pseudomonas hormoni]
MFTGTGSPSLQAHSEEGIDRWLEVQRALIVSSTAVNYVSKAVYAERKFGKRRIVYISKSDIELFQAQLLKQGLAPKTVNDIFSVVRGVWADAFGDGILKANPLDRISNVGSDVDLEHAAPFSHNKIELIGKADPDRRAGTRMIEFNCRAGLSLPSLSDSPLKTSILKPIWHTSAGHLSSVNSKSLKNAPGYAWRVSCRKYWG